MFRNTIIVMNICCLLVKQLMTIVILCSHLRRREKGKVFSVWSMPRLCKTLQLSVGYSHGNSVDEEELEVSP
jgi:acid phosphatase family membrane protein YuiD